MPWPIRPSANDSMMSVKRFFPREQQTPEALRAFQKAEIEKWWPILKEGASRGNSPQPMSPSGHFRPTSEAFAYRRLPLRPKSRHSAGVRDGLRLVDLDRARVERRHMTKASATSRRS